MMAIESTFTTSSAFGKGLSSSRYHCGVRPSAPCCDAPLRPELGVMRTCRGHREIDAIVESPGGLSPPGAPRTVREPLDSYGQSLCS